MPLELRQERHGGVLVLSPVGRLDNDSAADFELAAQELLGAGERHLVVDLAGLNYISNAGLRVLANTAKALGTPGTSMRLAALSPALRQVFDAAGFTAMFDIHPDRDAALGSHPAARAGSDLGTLAARLLGCTPPADAGPPPEAIVKLADLALELLMGAAQPRAARALAEGTRVQPNVRAAPPAPPASVEKRGWLARLFRR